MRKLIAALVLSGLLAVTAGVLTAQNSNGNTNANANTNTGSTNNGDPAVKVWVNKTSKVYHCPGSRYYGKTKSGEYMTQGEAQAAGNHPAGGKACPAAQ